MKTSKKVLLIIILLAGAALMAACGGGVAPATSAPSAPTAKPATAVPATVAPTATTVPPTAVPATETPQSPTETPVPPQPTGKPTAAVASGYDGEWEGKSSTNSPLNFKVENNKITYLTINYSFSSGGCSVGGAYGNGPENGSINGNQFSAQMTDGDGVQYSFSGTMTSPTDASGTLDVKGKTFCGDTDAKATWTAKNTSIASAPGDNVTPTEVAQERPPTAESSDADAQNVFGLFFLYIDTKDVNDAMGQVTDNVIFRIGSSSGIGKAKLKAFLQEQVDKGNVYMGSNVKATGNVVTFSVQSQDASGAVLASYNKSVVTVQDGKIVSIAMQ